MLFCNKFVILLGYPGNGNDGVGKPEKLRHRDGWSRRIDDANRLVYQLKYDGSIEIMQCKGHYDD